jgi:glycosyltransferase involved in cell wall biosynthesis
MLQFDVVTIVKNGEDSILKTLASVSSQSYPFVNHIIIDGNSSDLTTDVVESFTHNKKTYLYQQKNIGIAGAFNEGIGKSIGDFTLFLNAGDKFVDNEVIATIVNSYTIHQWQWAFGETISTSRRGIIRRHIKQYKKWSNSLFLYGNPICHQSTIFCRTFIEKVGLYNENLNLEMDYDFNIRSALISDPFLLNFLVSFYDTTGISSTKVFEHYKVHKSIRDKYFYVPSPSREKLDVICFLKAIKRLAMIPAKLFL